METQQTTVTVQGRMVLHVCLSKLMVCLEGLSRRYTGVHEVLLNSGMISYSTEGL